MQEPIRRLRDSNPLVWSFHRNTASVRGDPDLAAATPRPGREQPAAPWTPLPTSSEDATGFPEAVARRFSCRAFAPDQITLPCLAALLRSAYGTVATAPDRAVPSAGGLYPLELSVVVRAVQGLDPGVHHFVPAADGLERIRTGPVPTPLLTRLFLGQRWAAEAAAVVVISAVPGRSLPKYGDRGYRYLLIEAGHVGQNLALAAAEIGIGSICLGGFVDVGLARLLQIDPESEIVLYAIAVGTPDGDSRAINAREKRYFMGDAHIELIFNPVRGE